MRFLYIFSLLCCSLMLGLPSAIGQRAITQITPSSVAQGASDIEITFTLSNGPPPAPPQHVLPDSVTIGDITGQSVSRPDSSSVVATFAFPADLATGDYDAVITFSSPRGQFEYASIAGFSITSTDTAPVVTLQPQSAKIAVGGAVTFVCEVSSDSAVTYQWFHNTDPVLNATTTELTISPVTLADGGPYTCVATNTFGSVTTAAAILNVFSDQHLPDYAIVDTSQIRNYGNTNSIPPPAPGDAFAGQDEQYRGHVPFYTVSDDGLTVYDNITRLTWTQSADANGDDVINAQDKVTYQTAQAHIDGLNANSFGGFNDWRIPTLKELYSLIDFTGIDPGGMTGPPTPQNEPFIDRSVFGFAYGDLSSGERLIDAQFVTSTLYVDTIFNGQAAVFGLNLADGRIKAYPLGLDFYILAVRGNTKYGVNQFVDNNDGTVTDLATGLMWQKADSGAGMDWEDALSYAESLELAGYRDWRLPNAKELQSLIDYTRAPGVTNSPAIDPVFQATGIVNEVEQADYPWYWTSTTFLNNSSEPGGDAVYFCFGRSMGYFNDSWLDVHGAGAQRGDPKSGNLSDFTYVFDGYYLDVAPQGDAVRIMNYVRSVRGAATPPFADADQDGISDWDEFAYVGDTTSLTPDGDLDGDGQSNLDEISAGFKLDNPGSVFSVEETVFSRGDLTLSWPSALGKVYIITQSTDLIEFTPVSGEITAETPQNSFTLESITSPMFYRVELLPQQGGGPPPPP
ncbi:DUF1566 domain-containing protein [Rubellicoccus peritrichatus]|uniref:DUF1566 domain-containing protein n=1 Tax=Rubellicoccus peritrichatus TaxID=3080537 RepID=A0AAQ3L7F7_9BACT|nr:DUF1566 domain-containing protein [Puniceicoccus sp. CR14]WOO39337.1 DUF1566 domain-containing protein [Puniceicoccus sp. CR14]